MIPIKINNRAELELYHQKCASEIISKRKDKLRIYYSNLKFTLSDEVQDSIRKLNVTKSDYLRYQKFEKIIMSNGNLDEFLLTKDVSKIIDKVSVMKKIGFENQYEALIYVKCNSNKKLNKYFDLTSSYSDNYIVLRKMYLEQVVKTSLVDLLKEVNYYKLKDDLKGYYSSVSLSSLILRIYYFNREVDKLLDDSNNFRNKDNYEVAIQFLLNKIVIPKNNNILTKYVFNYDDYEDKARVTTIKLMMVRTCPYCNRQYITNYKIDNSSRVTADLDHYYCQSKYPYLGLSLYNFVPSCHICNSRLKNREDFYLYRHLNPHVISSLRKLEFKIESDKGINYLLKYKLNDDKDFNITLSNNYAINDPNHICVQNHIRTFQLNNIYTSHKNYVNDILKKAKKYNQTQIEELMLDKKLFKSENEVKEFIFGEYYLDADKNNRPLSKLAEDILKEIGIC